MTRGRCSPAAGVNQCPFSKRLTAPSVAVNTNGVKQVVQSDSAWVKVLKKKFKACQSPVKAIRLSYDSPPFSSPDLVISSEGIQRPRWLWGDRDGCNQLQSDFVQDAQIQSRQETHPSIDHQNWHWVLSPVDVDDKGVRTAADECPLLAVFVRAP